MPPPDATTPERRSQAGSRILDGPLIDLAGRADLVTGEFHPLADFAGFGGEEAAILQASAPDIEVLSDSVAEAVASRLAPRLAAAGVSAQIKRECLAGWLAGSSTGPFDGHFANRIRALSHLDGGVTFPGVSAPMPPQMVVATMAWVQGQILLALGNVTDAITLSGLGGIWMDQLLLQLSIMLEPVLGEPCGPTSMGSVGEEHPYADLAGLGPPERELLGQTAAWLAPAATGMLSLTYGYLSSRPESAPYVPADRAAFGPAGGLRAVAEHVGGLPPQLAIAVAAWVALRLMVALGATAAGTPPGPGDLGLGDSVALATVARAWMAALTIQLGMVLGPRLGRSGSRRGAHP